MIRFGDKTIMFSVDMLSKKALKEMKSSHCSNVFFINHVKNTVFSDYVFTEGVFF